MLGGLKGYSGGRMILPWYRPPSNSVSLGPRIVKCHSNILSYGVELVGVVMKILILFSINI